MFQKHARKTCGGVQVHVVDRTLFDAYRTGLAVLVAARRLWPRDFAWRSEAYEFRHDVLAIDSLTGTPAVREAIDAGRDFETVADTASSGTDAFDGGRTAALLY